MPDKTHLTYDEAAKAFTERGISVSSRTVRHWGRIGKIEVAKLGHKIARIPVSAIDKMIKENTR